MFQALVITLREGVEAALVVGIVLGYLQKTGRQAWTRIVYWGLASAVAASLVAGYELHRLEMTDLSDAYEGALMLVGAVFVASMVVWMWSAGKRLKQEIEGRLQELSTSPSSGAALGLFTFVFLMVFREGIETVLFLGAVSLRTSNQLLEFTGGLIGLALALGFGVAFFKGSFRVNLRKFFSVTSIVLLAVSLQLLVTGVHELSEAQVLPSSPREMALVGPFVNNDSLFFVVIIALCVFLVIAQRLEVGSPAGARFVDANGPERRKLLAARNRDRRWKLTATAAGLAVMVLISAQFIYSRVAQAVSPPEPIAVTNAVLRIPVSKLADHRLHRFAVAMGASEVRLIAILDSADTVRVALDACAICGSQGYYQDGQNVICRNCAAAVYVPTIGLAGGCNPIRLDPPYQVEGDTIVISEAALLAGSKRFH